MFNQNFGAILKSQRKSKHLTQEDVSKMLCISRQAYSNYEQGRCFPPTDNMAQLSILLEANLFQALDQPDIINKISFPADFSSKSKNLQQLLNLYSSLSESEQIELLNHINTTYVQCKERYK